MARQLKLGPGLQKNTGHTEWCDGRVHHSGFTTAFPPNTKVLYQHDGVANDIDFNSVQEGKRSDQGSYADVTSWSYHSGGLVKGGLVNVGLMDGATRTVSDKIELGVWRALGTVSGGEIVGEF